MRKGLLQLFSILSISLIVSCEKEDKQFLLITNTTNAGELNKTQVVKIQKSNAILSELSGAAVKELSMDFYQTPADNPFDGEFWTVTFQPGETTKYLKLNI